MSSSDIIAGVNLGNSPVGRYASDPQYAVKVGGIYNKLSSRLQNSNDPEQYTQYIKSHTPNSPITGDMIAASSSKYGIDPKVLTAVLQNESQFGTAGQAVRTQNAGNVGNTDSGASRNFSSWDEGVDSTAHELARRKIDSATISKATPQSNAVFGGGDVQKKSLAQSIKEKYPQYADIPDAQLEQKILAKYPQYSDMASSSSPSKGESSNQFVNPDSNSPSTNDFVQAPTSVPEQPDTTTPTPPEDLGVAGKVLAGPLGQKIAGVLKGVETPFISGTAKPVQYLAKSLGQPDPYAGGVPTPFGKVEPNSATLEHTAGDVAQVGSYFVPGSGVLAATGMGALQGAGSAMSQGQDLGSVAIGGAEGGLLGGALAGGTKLAGGLLESAGKAASGESSQKALQGIKDAYGSALNLNAGERGFESRSGRDLADVLMKNKVPLGRYENGTLDASAAIPKLQEALAPLNEQANQLVSHPQGVVKSISLSDSLSQLIKNIKGKNLDPLEEESAIAHANSLFAAAGRRYGTDELTPAMAEELKQSLQGSAFKGKLISSDKLQNNINYLASDVMKKNVEDSVAGTDAGPVLKELNSQRSDLIDAIKRLSSLDGVRLLKGGKLGHIMGGTIGAIAGAASGAGPLGVIAGDYFGNKAAQFLTDPATKIGIAESKANVMGKIPEILGKNAKPIGNAISKIGGAVKNKSRIAGLIGNSLSK